MKTPTLCLSMIVKNESKIIIRLLQSVIDIIDCYCICDTGSTDDTISVINNFFKDKKIYGKIIEIPFQNFSYNRNLLLEHSKNIADYILLLDADMVLKINNFDKNTLLCADGFHIFQGNEKFLYKNVRIIKNNRVFKYFGVTHEYIDVPDNMTIYDIPKNILFIDDIGDGGCKADKFERDIRLLTDGISKEPNNSRYYFYLANSYYDLQKYENALLLYEKRIKMGGWIEEVWYSYYRSGLCYRNMGKIHDAIYIWLEGFSFHSKRIENLYEIINHYRIISQYKLANYFYQIAKSNMEEINENNMGSYLFLHKDIYDYKLDLEYTIFSSYIGVKNIDKYIVSILNKCPEENIRMNILQNIKFYQTILCNHSSCKKKNFNNNQIMSINNAEYLFHSSSSCLIPNNQKDGYIMNVRYVNYFIDNMGSYSYKNSIISLNQCFILNNNFEIKTDEWLDINWDNRLYMGIEDIRIFNNKDNIVFIGTSFHNNESVGLCFGNYDKQLKGKELVCDFNYSVCEKNWVYVNYKEKMHIIYKWYPLQIAKINEERNVIELIETKTLPMIFAYCRGSSCGFNYKDEIWFVVHMVSYEIPRHYYHMIAVFNDNMDCLRYSAPFKFDGYPIEYCLSIIVNDDNVVMNYSTWDRTTDIAIFDKKYIDDMLLYV